MRVGQLIQCVVTVTAMSCDLTPPDLCQLRSPDIVQDAVDESWNVFLERYYA